MTNEQLAEHVGILVQSLRAEMNKRFEQIDGRLTRIEVKIEQHDARFSKNLDGQKTFLEKLEHESPQRYG